MTKVEHFCDRCSGLILADRTEATIEAGPLLRRMESVELCGGCAADWSAWLDTPPAPGQAVDFLGSPRGAGGELGRKIGPGDNFNRAVQKAVGLGQSPASGPLGKRMAG